MKYNYCVVFDEPEPIFSIGKWAKISGPFDLVLGHSFFGDLFLMNSQTKQVSILYVMPPELNEMQFYGRSSFLNDCISHDIIREDVLCVEKVDLLVKLIGNLEKGQVYIPEPYPFLGGDLSIASYSKGDFKTFLSFIGDLQLA